MPPFGPLYRQKVVVEEILANDREIVFDPGSHRERYYFCSQACKVEFDDQSCRARALGGVRDILKDGPAENRPSNRTGA
jgi:hypothetical protein